ncbi:uncharacterized protein K452DRAFT_9064, partial [Aplosporella prunicola CBS 121167]
MLIGLCGGICAGKTTVANYLIEEHGFQRLHVSSPENATAAEEEEASSPPPTNPTTSTHPVQTFPTIDALLEHVTQHWRTPFVTTTIPTLPALDALQRRPFFLLIGIDAPISARWTRHRARCLAASLPAPTLEAFVLASDAHAYRGPAHPAALLHRAQLRVLNAGSSLPALRASLAALDLPSHERLRPGWDTYFMLLAGLAAQRSNCMKRRVGCVLVRERRVVSTGYNGTPRNMRNCNEGGCPRCNAAHPGGSQLHTCLCIHAEENALLEAGRERIRAGCILYCDTCPCLTCSIKITQVGIAEVVYRHAYSMDEAAAAVFREGGVVLRQFVPPQEGLVEVGGAGEGEDEDGVDVRALAKDLSVRSNTT